MKGIGSLISVTAWTACYRSACRTFRYCPSCRISCLEITIGQDILIQAFYFSCNGDFIGCTSNYKSLSETVVSIYRSDIVRIPVYVYFFSRAICIIDLRIAEQISCKSLVCIEYDLICFYSYVLYCQIFLYRF